MKFVGVFLVVVFALQVFSPKLNHKNKPKLSLNPSTSISTRKNQE
jgi:hypothetical protein